MTGAKGLAQRADATGESAYDLVLAAGLTSRDELDDLLGDPARLTRPAAHGTTRRNGAVYIQ